MRVFVSHSKKDRDLVSPIVTSLEGQGHDVFFDEDDLPAGDEYDGRIRRAIDGCPVFVFCISGHSLKSGSYALSELEMAKQRWKHPRQHILPVLLDPELSFDGIPGYLKAVTVLRPKGNLTAEVSGAVARLRNMQRKRWAALGSIPLAIAVAVALVVSLMPSREERAMKLVASGDELEESGEYQAALADYEKALRFAPDLLPAHAGKAKVVYRLGRTDEAARLVEKGLGSPWDANSEADASSRARMRLIRATLKKREGQFDEAEADLLQALETLAPFATPSSLGLQASMEGTLGGLYQRSGRGEEAKHAYVRAIDLGRRAGDDRGVIQDQYNYSTLLRREKDYDGAKRVLGSALKTAVRLEFLESQVHVWWGFARTYEDSGDMSKARHAYMKALELLRNPEARIPNKVRTRGKVLGDFGAFLVDRVIAGTPGESGANWQLEAETNLKEALALSFGDDSGAPDLDGVGAQSANLGRLWLHTGRTGDAAALIETAHAVFHHIDPKLVTREEDESLSASIAEVNRLNIAPDFGSSQHLHTLASSTGVAVDWWRGLFEGVPAPPRE